jgi:toxin ParE1/3/4
MYSFVLTRDAEEDLDRIHEYGVHRFGMMQADKYYEMFFDCFDKIAFNPFMFPISLYFKKDIVIVYAVLIQFFIE